MDEEESKYKIEKCPKCGWWIINGWHWGEKIKTAEEAEK